MSASGTGPFPPAAARVVEVSMEDPGAALLRDLLLALQIRRLRGREDSRALEQAGNAYERLRQLTAAEGAVRLRRSGPHLFCNRQRILPRSDMRFTIQTFCGEWERLGLGGVEFSHELTPDGFAAFLNLYPRLDRLLAPAGRSETAPAPPATPAGLEGELPPGVCLLGADEVQGEGEEDPRTGARRAFFLALAGARTVVRHLAVHRVPELKISREVVHELIDTLVGEESSLIGLSAIQDFDQYTFQHSVHVSILSLALGQALGLPRRDLADLGVCALFHDLGKVRIPKPVLEKAGPFDAAEWALIRSHPLLGAREVVHGEMVTELAASIMLVAAEHHLCYDASGYPELGAGWRQGIAARIVSIADCYDAMTAARSYVTRALTPDAVVARMMERSGSAFDPCLLRLFVGKIGLYPVGTVLRLKSGDLALVTEPPRSPAEVEWPRVRLLRQGPQGWGPAGQRSLADPSLTPVERTIDGSCHPLDLKLDVDQALHGHYFPPAAPEGPPARAPAAPLPGRSPSERKA